MMSLFRRFAKSWVAALMMGLLIISFGIWGISDVFHHRISDAVIKAGSREISKAEFKNIFDNQLKQAQQQNGGQAVSAHDAVAQGFDRYLLQQLADNEAMAELIRREGIRPSDKLLVKRLQGYQAFFNPVSGAFDEKIYRQALAEHGLTPDQFEKGLRDDISQEQYTIGMVGGLRAPRAYTALIAGFTLQNRGAEYLVVDPHSVGTIPQPTDAQLTQFMKDHAAELKQPEFRLIKLVRFSATALAPTLKADPAAVQKRFDFEKERLTVPEKRTFVEIPVKDPAEATQVANRLKKGDDPHAVARSIGAKPIDYANAPKTSVADPKLADAVFALPQANQVAGPVQGAFGLAVAKLVSITPSKPAQLEDVRTQIESEVNQEAAQEKVYDQVQKYDDAHASGTPLDQAAAKAGVKVYQLPPMTADGKNPLGQPVTGMNQKMLQDAFSLSQGGETDVVDLGKGEYYALRVDKVVPSAVPPLNEIKPQLTMAFMRQELVKRVTAKADELTARVKKGETLQAVAASAGVAVQHATGISQSNARQHPELGQDFLGKLFEGKAGDVFTAPVQNGVAVGRISQIQNASAADVGRVAEQGRPQLTLQMVQADFTDMLKTAARQMVKPKVDAANAREAIGVAPDEGQAASGAPAKPAK